MALSVESDEDAVILVGLRDDDGVGAVGEEFFD